MDMTESSSSQNSEKRRTTEKAICGLIFEMLKKTLKNKKKYPLR
jgi:hypothetical protein